MDIRDVLNSKFEYVIGEAAVGRISAEIKSKSPPGYPILLYGEVIKQDHITFIGLEDKIKVLLV